MDEREAQELVRSVEAAWRIDFGQDGRRIWREAMMRYDSVIASIAVVKLAERQRERPTVADVRHMILKLEADQRADEPALPEPEPENIPTWVFVWRWARYVRDPREDRPFPQQHPHHQPPYLSEQVYEALRQEWRNAGEPGRNLRPEQVLHA